MQPADIDRRPYARNWLAAVMLAGVAFAAFAPAIGYGFVNCDDGAYVSLNEHVLSGLTASDVRWAFTTFTAGNWHPLTWLSLQVDASIWGSKPSGFHLTNVVLHAANAALLFLALRALTGASGASAAVALLFAIHPLRVESVAWVSERKDVLSTFFGLLALWAYAAYAAAPSVGRYLPVALALALSLMAKPMLVTLPFLLLVLDWWPLGRVRVLHDWRRLAAEKLPLFTVVAAVSGVAYVAQASGQATRDLSFLPLWMRVENAAASYATYLFKTVWPFNLAIFYPHPGPALPAWQVIGAVLLLVAVTAVAVLLRRRAPFLLAGWLWYLGTLIPTIGLVQVGDQAMADRYTYFPQIGILLALCHGAAELPLFQGRRAVVAAAAVSVALVAVMERQLTYWRDSVGLWEHVIEVSGTCPVALISIGQVRVEQERFEDALRYYKEAVDIAPYSVPGLTSLSNLLIRTGRQDEAVPHLQTLCRVVPDYALAHYQLGMIYFEQGNVDAAVGELREHCRLDPNSAAGYADLGSIYLRQDNLPAAPRLAADCFRRAVELEPDSARAHTGLGLALSRLGKKREGLAHLQAAARYEPGNAHTRALVGMALANCGDFRSAGDQLAEALRLEPNTARVWFDLGRVRQQQGLPDEAAKCWQRAADLDPRFAPPGNRGSTGVKTP
jgi:tetratricopeptide (TPR) repeat protein